LDYSKTMFLDWWARKTTEWVILMAVIQVIQIPHMVWNGDLLLEAGYVSRVNPVYDFILYGVDLIEIPSIMIALLTIVARIKNGK
jgi:hypothetical protein